MESMFRRMFKGAEGWLVIFTAPDLACYPFKYPEEVSAASAKAIGMADKDVFFGINLQKEKPAPGKRGKSEDVGVTFGLWQEFDIGGDGCIPDEKTMVKFLELIEVPDPSLLVHSGGGWHAYWVMESPMTDVEVISGLEPRFQKALAALFNNEGWKLDSVFDLARVLRVPGTTNHKQTTPRPVKLLNGDGPSYDLAKLVKMVEDLETKAAKVAASTARAAKAALPAVSPASDDEMAKDWFEIDGVKYPITERRRRYRNMLMSNKFPRSVSGTGGHKRMFHAACLRHGFALIIDEARPILEEYNETKCDPPWSQAELEHKLEDSVKFEDERTGWLLPDGRENIVIEQGDDEEPSDGHPTMPPEPTQQELYDLCRGTIYEPFIYEANKVINDINVLLPISGAVSLMSAWTSPCVRIGNDDADSFAPWSYVLFAANSSSGKGTVSSCVDSCMRAAGLFPYVEGSSRNLLKSMGSNPWSTLFGTELKDYIKPTSWQKDVLDYLKKASDGRTIGQNTETKGNLEVLNACPSFIGEVQPDLFMDMRMAAMASELGRDGFTNRCLVFHDTTIEPDEDKIGDLTSKYHMSVLPIHKVFAMFFDWLPERMTPAEEIKTSKMIRGKTVEQGAGKWVHPRSEFLLREEPTGEGKPYRSVLQGFKMRKEMKAHTIRMRKHYLPILAIPFESKENLKSGVISLLALEKADKLLVAFWYAACRFQLLIPNDWNDVKVKIISEKLKQLNSEEITGGRLRKKTQGAGTKNDREWKELLMHGMSIGAWTVTEKNKNGNPTLCIKPNYALGLSARQTLANPPANPLLYREYVLYKGGGLPLSSSKDDQDNELILLYGGVKHQNPTSPNLNDDVVSGLQQENGFAESGKPPKPPPPIGEFEF